MGLLIARLKVLPQEVGIELLKMVSSIERNLPAGAIIKRTGEEPIAFGLVALLLDVQIEEKEGSTDELEESVKKSKLVSEVQVLAVSKLSTRIG